MAGVHYIKFGRMVIASISLIINDNTALGLPLGVHNLMPIKCRDDNNGNFATFYITDGNLGVFNAENYTPGHSYEGTISYISAS